MANREKGTPTGFEFGALIRWRPSGLRHRWLFVGYCVDSERKTTDRAWIVREDGGGVGTFRARLSNIEPVEIVQGELGDYVRKRIRSGRAGLGTDFAIPTRDSLGESITAGVRARSRTFGNPILDPEKVGAWAHGLMVGSENRSGLLSVGSAENGGGA